MKKLLVASLSILLFNCTTKPWNKEAAKKWCIKDNKMHIDNGVVTAEKSDKICDCLAEKMYAKYKNEEALNADKFNQMLVGKECVESIETENSNTLVKPTKLNIAIQNFKNDLANANRNGVHLDSIYTELEGFVTLDYKVNNIDVKLINKKKYADSITADLKIQYQNNEAYKYFKENNIQLQVHYYDKNGTMMLYQNIN